MAVRSVWAGLTRGASSLPPTLRPNVRRMLLSSGATTQDGQESHADFRPQQRAPPAPMSAEEVTGQIRKDLKNNKIVVYMKGLPSAPQCGFSYRTVVLLNSMGVQYRAFNVLSSPELREGIKKFSSWPTIPQVYVDGEFIGGCDIMESMFSSGQLQQLLAEKKLLPERTNASEP